MQTSPQPKQYDYHSLINAYIDTQAKGFIHPDFEQFYRPRLAILEQVFGVKLSIMDVPQNRPLWMLFNATVMSYRATNTPRSGFLDDTLISKTLDRLGETGAEIHQLEIDLEGIVKQARSVYENLLARLFVAMYGEHPQIFTSENLKAFGFDDSTEPHSWDYGDYM